MSDVSEPLLRACRRRAEQQRLVDRVSFLRASADDLEELTAESVDIVTTRSVLIYLPLDRKRAAFQEFARVLRPGGRISLFEPINAWFGQCEAADRLWGFEVAAVRPLAEKIKAEYERATPAATSPLMDFSEHDLLAGALAAGLRPVRLVVEVTVEPGAWVTGWEALLNSAGNPLEPTFGEVLNNALSKDERNTFVAHLRPLVDGGRGERRAAYAYLTGVKPL